MARSRWIPSVVVALVAAALYLRTVGFEFVFDDLHLIVNNAFLREAWSPLTAFAHHFWHGTMFSAAYYRPVVVSSLALNGRVLGWGPAGFHLVNVLLHAINAALVLALARRLGTPGWASFCAALLFAVHPVAAWPVASIVARVDLLPALFVLLAWLALCAGTVSPLRRVTLAGLLFLQALLSKESALAFLVVPVLGLREMQEPDSHRGEGSGQPRRERTRRPVLAALAVALSAWIVVRRAIGLGLLLGQELIDPLTNPLGKLPATARIWAAIALAGRYVLYLIAPIRFSDPVNYLDPSTLPSPAGARVLLSLAVLLAWGAGTLVLWLRRNRVALPLAFSLASFLPASNILVPISSLYAQNFLYMPLIGLSLALGDVLGRLSPRGYLTASNEGGKTVLRLPRPVLFVAPVLAVLAAASFAETGIWRDGTSLFGAWTERFPNYSIAHSSLGVVLIGRGDPAGAIAPLRKALSLTERSTEAHYNLGVALVMTGKDPELLEEALAHLHRAVELTPDLAPARVDASKVDLLLERPGEAEQEAREALRLSPGFPPAMLNLGEALMQQSRYAEAAEEFEALAKLDPADTNVRSNYVVSLIHAGDMDRARAAAGAARQAFPRVAWFDFCLARVEARTGHATEALGLLQTALRKDAAARDWLDRVDEFEAYRGKPAFEAILAAGKKKGATGRQRPVAQQD